MKPACLSLNDQDIALWNALNKGDENSFILLFRKYYGHLFQYGIKIIAEHAVVEDSIQDLFAEIWTKKTATPAISVRAYLYAALKYKLLKKIQQQNKVVNLGDNGADTQFELSPENLVIKKEKSEADLQLLYNSISQLSKRQKEILYLKFFRQMSYEEITEIMNINYQVARNLLSQTIKALKDRLSVFL